ncbi:MAG TPA: A/G-specific adenine glycosylase [Methanoregulaceae archaeon]|jgi:A/G-specific adenine glycosylase|nr:A/G-specific adenine glycosylase [Methanoregulaceae archaeon]
MTTEAEPGQDSVDPPASGEFREKIWRYYREYRRDLPWRNTTDPYRILVSEIMLQQTQVDRVREKYHQFIGRFPDVRTLAEATTVEVLGVWQGLGYNRRALSLHRIAVQVERETGGRIPEDDASLRSMPGIGPYTSAAIQAFAFNKPVVMIETNIRRVYIHCFFGDRTGVADREILPLIEATLDRENPREWYNALMDYGYCLGSHAENPNRRSRHYQRQAPFIGSNRQLRGKIIRTLVQGGEMECDDLFRAVEEPGSMVEPVLTELETEGFIARDHDRVRIR